jgi:uncharacterized membrane protein
MNARILYAGDSPRHRPGAADYLLAVLRSLGARVCRIGSDEAMTPDDLNPRFDAILLSDYPRRLLASASQEKLIGKVMRGTGLAMIGGWASFSGPFGGWSGSRLETILPITCSRSDDRLNFPGGAHLWKCCPHPITESVSFSGVPAVMGINRIQPKPGCKVVMKIRPVLSGKVRPAYAKTLYPLLVLDDRFDRRIAAFATDFAPHWCGGLVDWGNSVRRLRVEARRVVQVGNRYIRFIAGLTHWLCRQN